MSGNKEFIGDAGGVHSMGSLEVSGNSNYGAGASASGTCSHTGNTTIGDVSVTGGDHPDCGENVPPVAIPDIRARQFHDAQVDAAGDWTYAGDWYDLCPDGTARRPSTTGPCQSSDVVNDHPDAIDPEFDHFFGAFLGWKDNAGQYRWERNGTMYDNPDGVFYVYERNARLPMTIKDRTAVRPQHPSSHCSGVSSSAATARA